MWFINCDTGSNTKAELMGAWATLTIANLLDLKNLQVLGDSKVIIDWQAWKARIKERMAAFEGINFQHIYRETNTVVDSLSKRALTSQKGKFIYFTWNCLSEGPALQINLF